MSRLRSFEVVADTAVAAAAKAANGELPLLPPLTGLP
jgi:hypothetical protein